MKKFYSISFLVVCVIIPVAASANGYIDDQNRAKALLSQCEKPAADRRGSQAWTDCIEGGRLWEATSKRLSQDIYQNVQNTDNERRRVQQDEMWRQQMRKN